MAQTYSILGQTEFGVPSGNYDGSSLLWYSDPTQAADYYKGRGSSTQTLSINVVDFTGRITIEATLDTEPPGATWFDIWEYDNASTVLTDHAYQTVEGNFVWVRARVELFESGIIQLVDITY